MSEGPAEDAKSIDALGFGALERSTGISGGRLDPQAVKWAFTQEASVGYAVEGYTSRQTQIPLPCQSTGVLCHAKDCFFGHDLNRAG